MIDLLVSPYPQEISSYIYKQIEKDLEEGKKSFLIVPEQYTLQSDIDFIDSIKYKTVMDAKVLSFNSLSRFIIDKLGKNELESLSSNGKIMLLNKILQDINGNLDLLKNAYTNVEFLEDISKLISNLKDYNFDQEFFDSIENSELDQLVKIKFGEIKKVLDAYQREIEGFYEDSEDKLAYVNSRLKECDFLQGANFYFDKFDSMSELRLLFIKELLKLDCKVSIGLSFDGKYFTNKFENDLEIYDEAKFFIRKLRELESLNIIEIEKESENKPDIKHLMENFDRYNPKIYKEEPRNIKILESISTISEVENIALLIKKEILKGKRYKDFSLIMTSAEEYENDLIRVFDRYEIPYFLDKTKKMSDNHIVKTRLSALRIVLYDFKKEDLEYFVRSKIYDFGPNSEEKIITFQNYIRKNKIKDKMFLNDKYFTFDESFYKKRPDLYQIRKEENDRVNEIREKILELLGPLYALKKKKAPAKVFASEIFRLIDKSAFKSGIDSYQEILKENNRLADYEENSQARDKFVNILEELVAIMKDLPSDFKKIFTLIEAACKNTSLGIIPPSKDHLLVTDFSRDRVNHTKYKIILGLNDVYFPSKVREEFLINENEKELLKSSGVDLKLYQIDRENRDLLNLYRMISSSETIYFSYALSDRASSQIHKSTVLNDIMEIFPNIKIDQKAVMDFEEKKFSEDMLKKYVNEILWRIIKKESLGEKDKLIAKSYLEYLRKNEGLDLLLAALFYSNDKKNLSYDTTKKLYPKKNRNVSEMESYGRCPYKYYLQYGIKAFEDQEFDVDYFEIGNIVHKNIEVLSKEIAGEDLDSLDDKRLEEILKENFLKNVSDNLDEKRRRDPKNQFILSNIYNNSKKNSKEIIKQLQQGLFSIDAVEERFAKNASYPEVYVDDENYLEGRIDRVDRFEDYIRIVDYKSGGKELRVYNILNGLDLQLVVYMISAKQKRDKDGLKKLVPVAAFYLPLKDELVRLEESFSKELVASYYEDKFKMEGLIVKINDQVMQMLDRDFDKSSSVFRIRRGKENIFSPEENELVENFVKNLIAKNIKEIKMGNISLNPIKYSESDYECARCPYRGVCKIDYSIDQNRFRLLDRNKKIDDLRGEDCD